jgi:hypothetical protein
MQSDEKVSVVCLDLKHSPVSPRKKGCSWPVAALVCGERWGIDGMYGRTSVVRTPQVGFLLIGLRFVFMLRSLSTDILDLESRSWIAPQLALIISYKHGKGLEHGWPDRNYS